MPFDTMQRMQQEDEMIRKNREALLQGPPRPQQKQQPTPLEPAGVAQPKPLNVDPEQGSMFLKAMERAPGMIKQGLFPGPQEPPEKVGMPKLEGPTASIADQPANFFDSGPRTDIGPNQVANRWTGLPEHKSAQMLRDMIGATGALQEQMPNIIPGAFGTVNQQLQNQGYMDTAKLQSENAKMADETARRGQDIHAKDLEQRRFDQQMQNMMMVRPVIEGQVRQEMPMANEAVREAEILKRVQRMGVSPPGAGQGVAAQAPAPSGEAEALSQLIGTQNDPVAALDSIIKARGVDYAKQNFDAILGRTGGEAARAKFMERMSPGWAETAIASPARGAATIGSWFTGEGLQPHPTFEETTNSVARQRNALLRAMGIQGRQPGTLLGR